MIITTIVFSLTFLLIFFHLKWSKLHSHRKIQLRQTESIKKERLVNYNKEVNIKKYIDQLDQSNKKGQGQVSGLGYKNLNI